MEELLQEHSRLIAVCANKLCQHYQCPQLREDLISVGNLTLLQMAGNYVPDSGVAISTYFYPFLIGAMRREIERTLYPVSLTKDGFKKYGSVWQSAFYSLEDYKETEKAFTASVEQQVFNKIYLDCMKEEFEKLSFKEREILGGFFGVYGYPKQTIADLAEEFQITENGLLKVKDRTVEKLRQNCKDGEMGIWCKVRSFLRKR